MPALALELLHLGRPRTLDVRQYSVDFVIAEDGAEPGHAGWVPGRRGGLAAVLHRGKQRFVGVVPRMPARIMGRRGHCPVGVGSLPVGLALQVAAVATSTVLHIHAAPEGYRLRVVRVGAADRGRATEDRIGDHNQHYSNETENKPRADLTERELL